VFLGLAKLAQRVRVNLMNINKKQKTAICFSIFLSGSVFAESGYTGASISDDVPTHKGSTATASSTAPTEEGPCLASTTNYSAFFAGLVEKPPRMLNPCGLGTLVDLNALKGFDPFGKLESAIKGAICGKIKSISDPFVNTFNEKVEQANRYVDEKNTQYGKWIDESADLVGRSLYDPEKYHDRTQFPPSTVNMDDIPPWIGREQPVREQPELEYDPFAAADDAAAAAEEAYAESEAGQNDAEVNELNDLLDQNGGVQGEGDVYITEPDWETFYDVY
jgi:hypothetical protein